MNLQQAAHKKELPHYRDPSGDPYGVMYMAIAHIMKSTVLDIQATRRPHDFGEHLQGLTIEHHISSDLEMT